MINRRTLLNLASATMIAGLSASRLNALQGNAGIAFRQMIQDIDTLSWALRRETLAIDAWREGLDTAFSRIELDDLRQAIDFDALAARAGYADTGVATTPVNLQIPSGETLSFFPKFFAVGRGRAIIPHGHANMLSAHLTLSGRFHLRQYDRISVSQDAVLIRPTVDTLAQEGTLSSIGDPDDNVHWFVAEENSHTLDIIITGVRPETEPGFDIFNIDAEAATSVDGDILRAPRLNVPDALAKYG